MRWFAFTLREGNPAPELLSFLKRRGFDIEFPQTPVQTQSLPTASQNLRYFPNLGVMAFLGPDDPGKELSEAPGVTSVVTPEQLSGSATGRWYINLLAAWDHVISKCDDFYGAVVNLSLGPPSIEANVFDPNEPLNRATRIACEKGVVVVTLAGNWGQEGNNTMTRWAQANWVISVGAANNDGKRVQPYSSRGLPGHPTLHPTVVAPDEQEPPTGEVGTSFAAPRVADIAMTLEQFFLCIWEQTIQLPTLAGPFPNLARKLQRDLLYSCPIASELKGAFPNLVRRCLEKMARPIKGELHERGAGFVSLPIALEFLKDLSLQEVVNLLPSTRPITKEHLKTSQDLLRDPLVLLSKFRVARFMLDTTYEWTLPTFVPGLLRMKRFFLLRRLDRYETRDDFQQATTELGNAEYHEISIVPHSEYARHLIVAQTGDGEFRTVSEALAQARNLDVIHVHPGTYEEVVHLKSGITLLGEEGAVLRHPSETPLVIRDAEAAALVCLEIVAEGPRKAAAMVLDSRNIVFRGCRARSLAGNAFNVYYSRRCYLDGCQIDGGINAGYFAYSPEIYLENTDVKGAQAGLLLYASSGAVSRCHLEGRGGDAVLFVPSNAPWTDQKEALVFTHPIGMAKVGIEEVSWKAVRKGDITGDLSRILYALEVSNSTLQGLRTGVAATDFEQVFLKNCLVSGGWSQFAIARSSAPLPVRFSGPIPVSEMLQIIHESIRTLEYHAVENR